MVAFRINLTTTAAVGPNGEYFLMAQPIYLNPVLEMGSSSIRIQGPDDCKSYDGRTSMSRILISLFVGFSLLTSPVYEELGRNL